MNRYGWTAVVGVAIAALVPWPALVPLNFIIPQPGRTPPADPLDDGLCIKQGSIYFHLIQIHGECPPGLTYRPVPEGPPHLMEVVR